MSEIPLLPALRTQADVERMWRRLMTPLGFASESLWFVVIDGEHPVPRILEVAELGEPPVDDELGKFVGIFETFAEPGVRFAVLRSRPGGGRPDPTDLGWARALYEAGRRAGARLEVIHLAHDHDVLPLTVDDVMVLRSTGR